jgi:hypothetical protein
MLGYPSSHIRSHALGFIQRDVIHTELIIPSISQESIWLRKKKPSRGLILRRVSSKATEESSKATEEIPSLDQSKDHVLGGSELYTVSLPGLPEPMGATFAADMVSCSLPR